MALPIGLQLYTLRAELEADSAGIFKKLAEIGYLGVETTGSFGSDAASVKLLKDLGITIVGMHSPLLNNENKNQFLDKIELQGIKRLICAYTPKERWTTVSDIHAVCDEINQTEAIARENGYTFLYHNHWFEYQMVEGRPANQILLERVAPTVGFEVDTYWVKVAGQNPADVVRELGSRAPLLHIKDGPAETPEQDMTAVGDGVMDWKAIIGAGQGSAEWLIVELDRCATDMMEAVAKSYQYLTREGFARGSKS
jgi:sugar phosphate isomerase/epimerase